MKLYQINQQIEDILSRYDDELPEEALDQIEALGLAEADKLESMGVWIKQLRAEEKALADEIKTLQSRKKSTENRADRIGKYLADYLLANGRDTFKSSKVAMSFRRSEVVEVADETLIPDAYKSYEVKVSKSDIKTAIKAGQAVSGAQLVERKNLQVK